MSEQRIYKAMSAIMADAKAIGKDSKNQSQGFMFRGIDAVMDHLHPVFAEHGVVIMPEVLEERTEERQTKSGSNLIYRILKIKFAFVADDGSSLSCTVIGEGMDSGDKAANKAMAVALKYALSQSLLLPYNEVDPDAETQEPSKPKAQAKADKPKLSSDDIKWYQYMDEFKKAVGEEMYRKILAMHQFKSSKDVTTKEARNAVYKHFSDQIKANAEAKLDAN